MQLKVVIPRDILINTISNFIEILATENVEMRNKIKEINNSNVKGFDMEFNDQGLEVKIEYSTIVTVN